MTKIPFLLNNISESFNSSILEAKDIPILSMLECIRMKLMKRFYVKHEQIMCYTSPICPDIQNMLQRIELESKDCFMTLAGNLRYKVALYNTSNVVNLFERPLTYKMWDLSGIPCKHIVVAIFYKRQ